MNLREGTRRLALLLGAVGAILGGFAGYTELQSYLSQRAQHNRFEQLANSQAAKGERNCILGTVGEQGCREPENGPYPNTTRVSLPNGEVRDYPSEMSNEQIEAALRKEFPPGINATIDPYAAMAEPGTAAKLPKGFKLDQRKVEANDWQDVPLPINDGPVTVIGPDGKTYHFPEGTDKNAAIRYFKMEGIGASSHSMDDPVHRDGIEVIHWGKNLEIESIETQDGQALYPTPAPRLGSYVLLALLPVLGFFIPWGAVRTIGWVGAGFAETSK